MIHSFASADTPSLVNVTFVMPSLSQIRLPMSEQKKEPDTDPSQGKVFRLGGCLFWLLAVLVIFEFLRNMSIVGGYDW